MTAVLASFLLGAGLGVYLGMLPSSWRVLDDPDHFTRERTHDLMEHIRFFGNLPKPERAWNQ